MNEQHITIKTLIQSWINGKDKTAESSWDNPEWVNRINAADAELSQHMNDGWQILNITVGAYVHDNIPIIDRTITLQRMSGK